ncbi:MAG: hypothetical protein LBD59_09380 [Prevotellaceae bacterium]|jgi:hypothetical protein|nr:hypothetical protein [Prevotellaceae bacterium]
MKKILLIGIFLMVSALCMAQTEYKKEFALGAGAGYTSDGMMAPEIFGQMNFKTKAIPLKAKLGCNYHPFNAQLRGLKKLKAEGIGLFAEADIYPFRKYLFAGVRWDGITFNWLTKSALSTVNENVSFIGFTGTNIYGLAGLDVPVFQRINLLLYGMFGAQQYKISDSGFSSGDYIVNNLVSEEHIRFVYQFNIAVSIRIK